MVKKINSIAVLIIFSLIAILFAGCKNSIEHSNKEKLVQVSGFVSTNGILEDESDNSAVSRTALPDVSGLDLYYKVVAVKGTDAKTSYSNSPSYTIGIGLGTWELSAYVYKGSSEADCTELNLLFEPNETVEVTVEERDIDNPKAGYGLSTKIVQGKGSGTVNLNIAVDSLDVADVVIAKMGYKTQNKLFNVSKLDQNIDFDNEEFTSGSYLLSLTFYKDGKLVFVCSQWVNIINGLQTTKWVIDNNTPYFDGSGFLLTSTCILYQNMTDFYVDPTATESKKFGTPYNPFTDLDQAYGVLKSIPFENFNIHVKADSVLTTSESYILDSVNTPALKNFSITTYDKNSENSFGKIIAGEDLPQFIKIDKSDLVVNLNDLDLDGTNINGASSGNKYSFINITDGDCFIKNCTIVTGKNGDSYAFGIIAGDKLNIDNSSLTINGRSNGNAAITIPNTGGHIELNNTVLKQGLYNSAKVSGIYIQNTSNASLVVSGSKTEISGFAYGICFSGKSDYSGTEYLYKINDGTITNNTNGIYLSGTTSGNVPLEISGSTISSNLKYAIDFGNAKNDEKITLGGSVVINGSVNLSSSTIISTNSKLQSNKTITIVCSYQVGTKVLEKNDFLDHNISLFTLGSSAYIINGEGELTQDIIYYIDENSISAIQTGFTPDTAFKTVSTALAVAKNNYINYTFKLCSNLHGNGSSHVISISNTVKAKSIIFESSDESVKRIIYANTKSNETDFSSGSCLYINAGTNNFDGIFNNLQFKGSRNTDGCIYVTGSNDYKSTMTFTNCIIGDEDTSELPTASSCANKTRGIYSKFKNIILDNTIVCNNAGAAIYCNGNVTIKNDSKISYNSSSANSVIEMFSASITEVVVSDSSITDNYSKNGKAISRNSSNMKVTLDGKVIITNNKSGDSLTENKYTNLFLSQATNDDLIYLGETFSSSSNIGITVAAYEGDERVISSGYNTYHSSLTPATVFFSDDSSKEITWNAENTEAVIKNKTAVANAYYVAGSDAKVLSVPAEGVTPDGSLKTPFTSVQAAVDAISVTESKTGVIYIDGTVEDNPQESGSESKCTVQITNGANITILGYTEGAATGGVMKTSQTDTRVIAIWDYDKLTTVTLGANLTITGGNVTTSNCGGGIVNGSILILDGCTITGNKVNGDTAMGGGVYCNQESITTIKPGTVISNNTSGKFGGGLTVCGGKLNIEGGKFSENGVVAADGSGSDIQLKVYEEWSGGVDTGVRQKSTVIIGNDFSHNGTILVGYDTSEVDKGPQTVTFTKEISNYYVFDLDSNIVAGDKFANLDTGISNSVYSKLKISTGDLYVDSEGIIREKTTPGGINIGNVNRTSVDIGVIDSVFFSKNDTANNVIILTLSNKAKAALGASAYVTFQLYSVYGGNDALISSKNIYITEGTAHYQLENFQNIEVGTYKLHVSAVSNNDNYVIESKIFTITVGY